MGNLVYDKLVDLLADRLWGVVPMDRASWCEEARRIVVRELKPGKDVEELSEKIVRTILHMKETEAPRKQMFAKTGKYIQQFLETTKPKDMAAPGEVVPELTLEEAKQRKVCRICGGPDNGELGWTYNYGKEFAHTRCLNPTTQQPEVAVSERDRELALWIKQFAFPFIGDPKRWSTYTEFKQGIERRITDHMATERGELSHFKKLAELNMGAILKAGEQIRDFQFALAETDLGKVLRRTAEIRMAGHQPTSAE